MRFREVRFAPEVDVKLMLILEHLTQPNTVIREPALPHFQRISERFLAYRFWRIDLHN